MPIRSIGLPKGLAAPGCFAQPEVDEEVQLAAVASRSCPLGSELSRLVQQLGPGISEHGPSHIVIDARPHGGQDVPHVGPCGQAAGFQSYQAVGMPSEAEMDVGAVALRSSRLLLVREVSEMDAEQLPVLSHPYSVGHIVRRDEEAGLQLQRLHLMRLVVLRGLSRNPPLVSHRSPPNDPSQRLWRPRSPLYLRDFHPLATAPPR